jgi:hypothetical protein
MQSNNITVLVNLIDGLLNDVENKMSSSYLLKTRLDRIIIKTTEISKYIDIQEEYRELSLIYSDCYGGSSCISNLDDIINKLNKLREILLNYV